MACSYHKKCIDYSKGCKRCDQNRKFFGNPDSDTDQYLRDMMFQDIKVK